MLYTNPQHTAKTILKQIKNIPLNQAVYFRRLAENLIAKNPNIKNNTTQELSYLFNQLKSMCRYTLEPEDIETLKTPLGIIRDFYNYGYLIGDCDDMTMFCCLVLYFLGYDIGCKIVKQNGEQIFSHIYPVVKLQDGNIYAFDLCCNYGFGVEMNNITESRIFFYTDI